MNLSEILLEEIALDGLDGITLESLWFRLLHRNLTPKFPLKLDDRVKTYLWTHVITKLKPVSGVWVGQHFATVQLFIAW